MDIIKGYKVFNPDWTANHDNFRYEVGKEYEMGGEIIPCKRGFHFCKNLISCFDFYEFGIDCKIAEVEGSGQIKQEGNKICCSHIRIIKEMPINVAISILNEGRYNVGLGNRGEKNSGRSNIGAGNSGNYNDGICNQGNGNHGDFNYGETNLGYKNQGRYNDGNENQGQTNKGNYNRGDYNQGDYNQGDRNQGNCNIGSANKGDNNIGLGNKGTGIIGLFCTERTPFYLFNKLCRIPRENLEKMEGFELLLRLSYSLHPYGEWMFYTKEQKRAIKQLPNFNPKVFKKLYGIDITKDK